MNSVRRAPPLAGNVLGSIQNDFVIAEWHDPGGGYDPPRFIAPLHLHREDDEAWYVLEGTLRLKMGDEEIELRAGSGAIVPRGTPHTYWNPEKGRTRYLLMMTPRIYRLIQGIHTITDRTPTVMQALFEDHNSVLLA